MNSTPLETTYKDLILRLWEDLLFYIPDNETTKEYFKNHNEIDFEKFRNEILVIDRIEGPIVYQTGRDNSRPILKSSTLKKNIHQLLHKKANSNKSEFDYILELYYEQAECLYYITKWLKENIKHVLPLKDTKRVLFKMQYDHHRVHFETMIRHFYPNRHHIPKGNFDMAKSMESYFSDLSQLKDKIQEQTKSTTSSSDDEKSMDGTSVLDKKPVKRVTKKRPVITELEAETILLERIFNIDTNTIK